MTTSVAIQQLSNQARQALGAKNWPLVKQCASQILAQHKDSAEGWFLMGLSNRGLGQPAAAISAFQQALGSDSTRYDAATELANLLWQAGQHGAAKQLLDSSVEKLSRSPKYLFVAAETYTRLGLHGQAWPLYQLANTLQTNAPAIQAALAACATKVGEIDQAIALYDKLLADNPHHQRNHYERSRLQTAVDDRRIDAMQASLDTTQLPAQKNIFLYYALAKELEDRERWAEAFEFYQAGGNAAHQQCAAAGYTVAQDIALMKGLQEVCTADWIEMGYQGRKADPAEPQPIFVVGLPRTGTTLVEKIISAHSQVETVDESFFLELAIKRASRLRSITEMTLSVVKAAADNTQADLARDYLTAVDYRLSGQPYFVEKYPFNFLYVGFIRKYFPTAKIVLLKRQPMDACFAMYKQPFFKFSYTQTDLATYHNAYTQLMAHWQSSVPGLIEVEYEALVSDPESQIPLLLSSLELGFERSCVDYHHNATASATASSIQVREKPHTRSVNKWRNWEAELQSLKKGLHA